MKVTVNGLFSLGLTCMFLLQTGQALPASGPGSGLSLVPKPLLTQALQDGFQPGPRVVIDPGGLASMAENVDWLAELISEHSGRDVVVSPSPEQGSDIQLLLVSEQVMRDRFA